MRKGGQVRIVDLTQCGDADFTLSLLAAGVCVEAGLGVGAELQCFVVGARGLEHFGVGELGSKEARALAAGGRLEKAEAAAGCCAGVGSVYLLEVGAAEKALKRTG